LKSWADTGFIAAQIHGARKECDPNVAGIYESQVFWLFPCPKNQPGNGAEPTVCVIWAAGSAPKGVTKESGNGE
jgi:hypothetical protein